MVCLNYAKTIHEPCDSHYASHSLLAAALFLSCSIISSRGHTVTACMLYFSAFHFTRSNMMSEHELEVENWIIYRDYLMNCHDTMLNCNMYFHCYCDVLLWLMADFDHCKDFCKICIQTLNWMRREPTRSSLCCLTCQKRTSLVHGAYSI